MWENCICLYDEESVKVVIIFYWILIFEILYLLFYDLLRFGY